MVDIKIMDTPKLKIDDNYRKQYLLSCPNCGKERWVRIDQINASKFTGLCRTCATKANNQKPISEATRQRLSKAHIGIQTGANNPHWKGGRLKEGNYITVLLNPQNPFFLMAQRDGYIFEHRLVMAQHLRRLLLEKEVVHHVDGNCVNNNIGNLRLFNSKAGHLRYHRIIQGLAEAPTRIGGN